MANIVTGSELVKAVKDNTLIIRERLRDFEGWKERLDKNDQLIEETNRILDKERKARESGDDTLSKLTGKIEKRLGELQKSFATIRGGALVLYFFLSFVIIPLMFIFIPKIFK